MLLAQTLVAHRPGTFFTPDYAQEDLSTLLAQDSLSDSDYQTLFLQTGLGRSAVDRLLSAGEAGRAAIRQIQATFFADYTITCDPLLGWFTREDHLKDAQGQTAYAPELAGLQPGDILITLSTHSLGWRHGHAGLVVETEDGLTALECVVLGTNSRVVSLDHWRNYSNVAVLRVKGLDAEGRKEAADYAMEHLLDIPYHLSAGFLGPKAPDPDSFYFRACNAPTWCGTPGTPWAMIWTAMADGWPPPMTCFTATFWRWSSSMEWTPGSFSTVHRFPVFCAADRSPGLPFLCSVSSNYRTLQI